MSYRSVRVEVTRQAPGASMTVAMEWDARPSTLPRRQARAGRRFDFAQWYPKVVVYDRYGSLVYGLARRVTSSTAAAEEITQEVFVQFWEHADRFDATKGSLRAFLGAITHRRSVDWVRSEIPRLMAGVADLRVPLLAEIGFGPNWDKAH